VSHPLYHPVAFSLTGYARSRFRVRAIGERFELDPGGLIVSSHRSDSDVPVLVSLIYAQAHGRPRRRERKLHFAVRDDLFLRGVFSGLAPGLPSSARRMLFPIGIGNVFGSAVPCHPIRSATRLRLVELLREHREAPLDELVGEELARGFHERGLPRGARARDALSGRYADVLWRVCSPEELTGPLAEDSWFRRATAAASDFRALCELVRSGETLLIFPEGRPSPDGGLGPMQRGLAALMRRAKPQSLRPVGIAYDPLVGGRPYAYVGVGEPREPVADESEVLAQLRRATPLTAGQLVASGAGDRELDAAVEAAIADGRPVAPELLDPSRRRRRLADARAASSGRDVRRLAMEFRSARA
jgi:1-acyl-sn-glycerol-3-phosphate acyltransferase